MADQYKPGHTVAEGPAGAIDVVLGTQKSVQRGEIIPLCGNWHESHPKAIPGST